MKYYQLNVALQALVRLNQMQLPFNKALEVYKLVKKFNELQEFLTAETKKLIEKYHGEVVANGDIKFADDAVRDAFSQEYAQLQGMDIEEITPIVIAASSLGEQHFSSADILALEGWIQFE